MNLLPFDLGVPLSSLISFLITGSIMILSGFKSPPFAGSEILTVHLNMSTKFLASSSDDTLRTGSHSTQLVNSSRKSTRHHQFYYMNIDTMVPNSPGLQFLIWAGTTRSWGFSKTSHRKDHQLSYITAVMIIRYDVILFTQSTHAYMYINKIWVETKTSEGAKIVGAL